MQHVPVHWRQQGFLFGLSGSRIRPYPSKKLSLFFDGICFWSVMGVSVFHHLWAVCFYMRFNVCFWPFFPWPHYSFLCLPLSWSDICSMQCFFAQSHWRYNILRRTATHHTASTGDLASGISHSRVTRPACSFTLTFRVHQKMCIWFAPVTVLIRQNPLLKVV